MITITGAAAPPLSHPMWQIGEVYLGVQCLHGATQIASDASPDSPDGLFPFLGGDGRTMERKIY